jgi:membrane protease YdiL (CAAX protease family)
MPEPADLLYVALFAGVLPLLDYAFFWPRLRRLLGSDPPRGRRWLYATGIISPWIVVAAGAAIWMHYGRTWTSFGFVVPEGWRLWASVGLVLLLTAYFVSAAASLIRDAGVRENARRQMGEIPDIMPHTRGELRGFIGVSITAGFCEEFLFRGYFIWVLAPWLGWWGAAALSLLIFALGHAYQGWSGVLRTGIVGALFTLTVAIFDSLWPAIVLHAIVDVGAAVSAWLARSERVA